MEFLKTVKPYLEKRYEVVSDRADLYCYFYERGLRLLKPGGRLGYISSNTFFKTGSGGPLREYLLREATIEGAVDFGDLQIFEGVTTYPAILTMKRGPAPDGHELRFWKLDAVPESNFQAAWEAAAGPYPQASLGAGSWELEDTGLRALRDKIRKGKKTLKEVYGSPLRGIVTGLNDAFVIDTPTKERLCAEDPRSVDLLKPFLEGKDLKRWRAEPRGLWLIYIPKNRIKIDDYPAIRGWLLPFKDRLERRATKQEWFELQQAQEAYLPHFNDTKIVYPDLSQGPKFSLDNTSATFPNTGYFIPTDDTSLLAHLNSRLVWFFLRGISGVMRGGEWRLRLFTQYIEQIPLPRMDDLRWQSLSELTLKIEASSDARLDLQLAFARRIPDLCPAGRKAKLSTKLQEWWTLPDFAAFRAEVKEAFKADIPLAERTAWEEWIARDRAEIARLTSEIKQCEAEIDRIVYELFDLTPDEIALLESAIQA